MSDDLERLKQAEEDRAFEARKTAPLPAGVTYAVAGERARLKRASISDSLDAVRPDAGPIVLQSVEQMEHVRRVALALDQVAHRTDAVLAEHGYVLGDIHKSNADDFAVVTRLTGELETALAVIKHMAKITSDRLSAAPQKPANANQQGRDAVDKEQYQKEVSGHAAPGDAAPDSPHGGLGKGKQEAIENALAGETGDKGIADHAVDTGQAGAKPASKPADKPKEELKPAPKK